MSKWQPMETAPRDGTPILAWCRHEADPYVEPGSFGQTLTPYGVHCEGVTRVEDGPHVVEWGGEYDDGEDVLPNWWFRVGSDFEEAANPVCWQPITPPEEADLT